jgi:Ca2+-binding RTX toxin-like protein
MATQPTAQDQYMLELLNRARLNPQAEANRLLNGNLNEGLAAGTITATAKQALAFNLNLFNAAQGHSQWQLANNTFSHTGANGTSSATRVTNAGYSWSATGENIAWQGTTGTADLTTFVGQEQDSLFADLTVAGRGHRTNMLNANYREIGISAIAGPFASGGTTYNAVMTTQDFGTDATNSNAFLTGVVYTDGVTNDDFYTVGEGLGNITITAVGNGQTVTGNSMTAGGYSLRLAAGTYSVTFGGDFNNDGIADTSIARSVTIGSQNVKVDFASDTYVPPVATPTEGDDVLTGTASADNINALGGNDRVSGLAGNDTLYGGAGNDTLYGGDGNNTLNGGAGNDALYNSATSVDNLAGGAGDDFYEVLNGLSTISETAGEGTDTVFTNVSYTLAANVENMYLYGSSNGTGNAGDNTIVGAGAGDNLIDGGAGNDNLFGGDGNDILKGGAGNNALNGGAGNDILYSSATSVDNLAGGAGDDIYEVLNGLSTISENAGEGTDTVFTNVSYTLAANVENMYLFGSSNGTGNAGDNTIVGAGAGDNVIDGGAGNDTLSGGDGNDILKGGAGNNTLNGGAGNDILYSSATSVDNLAGGTGDDMYEVLNGLSTISENAGEGTDTVFTNVSYTLAANVENMYLFGSSNGTGNAGDNTIVGAGAGDNLIDGGAGNDNLSGGDGNDTLKGGTGNNTLNGGAGNDWLYSAATSVDNLAGGFGDDLYEVLNGSSTISENAGEGTDTVFTNVSYTLAANVENMYLYGSSNGTGNSGNNTIVGTGIGDNVIAGGAGNDTLYGGAGNDVFVFDSSSFLNSVISGIDTIGDFTATQDKIQLSKAAFAALSTSAGTLSAYNSTALTGDFVTVTNATQATFAASAATILYNSDTGALLYNADGNIAGFGNGGQFAGLTTGLGLTNNDFRAIA